MEISSVKLENTSFSQEGEDMLLTRVIGNIKYQGSYVDIGAHHPIKFSNTYKFYLAGWRGMNVEANPGSKILFDDIRPFDKNFEIPISDKNETLTFYRFNRPELNSFSLAQVEKWDGKGGAKLIEKIDLQTTTINSLLQLDSINYKHYDLLSIDIEGLDYSILNSLDYSKYSFSFIIVEDSTPLFQIMDSSIYQLLTQNNYVLLSRLYYSNIYYLDFNSNYGKEILNREKAFPLGSGLYTNTWIGPFLDAKNKILTYIPEGGKVCLIDENILNLKEDYEFRHFIKSKFLSYGAPANSEEAVRLIFDTVSQGAEYLIFIWQTMWWLEYYAELNKSLINEFKLIYKSESIIIYKLKAI